MFPPSSAIYDAPSICLPEIFGLLADLSSGDLTTIVSNYLNPSTFQTNSCGVRLLKLSFIIVITFKRKYEDIIITFMYELDDSNN